MRALARQPKRTAAHSKEICAHVLIAAASLLLGMRGIVAVRGIIDSAELPRIGVPVGTSVLHCTVSIGLRVKCEASPLSPRRGEGSHGHVSGERTSSLAAETSLHRTQATCRKCSRNSCHSPPSGDQLNSIYAAPIYFDCFGSPSNGLSGCISALLTPPYEVAVVLRPQTLKRAPRLLPLTRDAGFGRGVIELALDHTRDHECARSAPGAHPKGR